MTNTQLAELQQAKENAVKRAKLCEEFEAKVIDLLNLHKRIVELKNDYTYFEERIQEYNPDHEDYADWEESGWEESSC